MKPIIKDKTTAIVVGLVLVVVGGCILYGAWEGRGAKKPWYLGPFLPW